jgi:hypothetical protein
VFSAASSNREERCEFALAIEYGRDLPGHKRERWLRVYPLVVEVEASGS